MGYISTTDAVCYHDGHRSLQGWRQGPVHEVPIFGDDAALRDERTIRVTDMAFDEDVLLDQDRYLSDLLTRPEFQHKMTGTELRHLLGKFYAGQEQRVGAAPGLLATCHRMSIPVFVGAPADGSVFLNSMKLWAMRKAGMIPEYGFDLDLHAEVFEACAYHRWGLFDHDAHALATLILGGGVPKNYNLQPEPALGQILGLPDVRGYHFDVQITTAPITDGSLSSCPPAEAVTWGKVDKDVYLKTTESMQGDFSMVMPFLIGALIQNRDRYTPGWPRRWARTLSLRSTPRRAATFGPAKATACSSSETNWCVAWRRMSSRIANGCSTQSDCQQDRARRSLRDPLHRDHVPAQLILIVRQAGLRIRVGP